MSENDLQGLARKLRLGQAAPHDLVAAAEVVQQYAAVLARPAAGYAVHLPGRVPDRALFIDHGRAEQFAAQHHGTITPMVEAWPRS